MSEIHGLLLEAGYQPWSSVTNKIYFAIADAFELLGESCSGLLINHLSEIHRIPKHVVLTRYDLISKAIGQTFGYGSEVFLHQVRQNLLGCFPCDDQSISTLDIIRNAYRKETLQFIGALKDERVVVLHGGSSCREETLGAFSATRFANTASSIVFVDGSEQGESEKICRHQAGDDIWIAGKAAGGHSLCTFNTEKAVDNFRSLVLPHTHVITEDPFLIYTAPEDGILVESKKTRWQDYELIDRRAA